MNAASCARLVLAACAAFLCVPADVQAWGQSGHRFMTAAAIQELPAPLRTYFQARASLLTNNAAIEPPGTHYIDIDYYPEFFAGAFPRDLGDLIARYGSTVVNQKGTGPWAAVTNYNTLCARFATAQTEGDWTNLLSTAASLAHLLEDLHNPMHLATNYDGQFTGQSGLHSRYETTLIQNRLAAGLTLATNLAGCLYYPSLQDAIFDDIAIVYTNNATLLAADLAAYAAAGSRSSSNYYWHLWDAGCSSFTPRVMQRGADMVASAWYSAWRDAGFPQLPGVTPSTRFRLQLLGSVPSAFRFAVEGDVGQRLNIQVSTNLLDWTPHASVTNLDGRIEFRAPPPDGFGQRYYRAVLVQ